MNTPISDAWYNAERVAQPGSVILKKFVADRTALREGQARQAAIKSANKRMYAGAVSNRLTADWNALGTSADSEILTSIRLLRARSREMVRDNAHAKNAVRIVQNNVVGQGIGLQAQVTTPRGKLNDKINDEIESAWADWSKRKTCHTAGLLCLSDILRLAMGQMVEAGEVILRKVRQPFGGGKTPFALEVIEADRLMDQWQTASAPNGNRIRMGVEIDDWSRPVAYWFFPTHPGDYQFKTFVPSKFIRIPAEDIIHLYIVDRIPQTRGVPWFHAVLRRMNDMKGYAEAEIVAARASASVMGLIKSPEIPPSDDGETTGQPLYDMAPGQIHHLMPGEDFVGFNPARPNSGLEPFMRYMLREMAAGVGTSYESLSRDYSQSNYSSSRLALMDDRDLWRVLQGWLITTALQDIYSEWLDAAVLAGDVRIPDYYSDRFRYQKVRFKPRGWNWIDPMKEVKAYKEAVLAGFMTVSDVIGLTSGGQDAEDVFKSRRQELDMMADLDLVFDTDITKVDGKGTAQAIDPGKDVEAPDEDATETDSDETKETKPAKAE